MNETKVSGTITENHVSEVANTFGKDVAEALENAQNKTFLDILIEMGRI